MPSQNSESRRDLVTSTVKPNSMGTYLANTADRSELLMDLHPRYIISKLYRVYKLTKFAF